MYHCRECNIKLSARNKHFCSNACQGINSSKKTVQKWLSKKITGHSGKVLALKPAIRNYLLKQSNYQCSICAWKEVNLTTGKVPLEIDHINGNPSDSYENNLRVLCPNCHSLTSTFKNLNCTRGVRNRRQVDQSGNGPAL